MKVKGCESSQLETWTWDIALLHSGHIVEIVSWWLLNMHPQICFGMLRWGDGHQENLKEWGTPGVLWDNDLMGQLGIQKVYICPWIKDRATGCLTDFVVTKSRQVHEDCGLKSLPLSPSHSYQDHLACWLILKHKLIFDIFRQAMLKVIIQRRRVPPIFHFQEHAAVPLSLALLEIREIMRATLEHSVGKLDSWKAKKHWIKKLTAAVLTVTVACWL